MKLNIESHQIMLAIMDTTRQYMDNKYSQDVTIIILVSGLICPHHGTIHAWSGQLVCPRPSIRQCVHSIFICVHELCNGILQNRVFTEYLIPQVLNLLKFWVRLDLWDQMSKVKVKGSCIIMPEYRILHAWPSVFQNHTRPKSVMSRNFIIATQLDKFRISFWKFE